MQRVAVVVFGSFLTIGALALPAAAGPSARQVSMAVAPSVVEGGTATVNVSLNRRPGSRVTVHVATVDHTAHAGVDYTAVSTDVVFTPRQWAPVNVPVATLVDDAQLYDVTFGVALTSVHGSYAVATPTASITITRLEPSDRQTQAELVRALGDENIALVPQHVFVTSSATMRAIDPALDWGGRLTVRVNDAIFSGDEDLVCLQETSATNTVFAIAQVEGGAESGIFFSRGGDCALALAAQVAGSAWNTGWGAAADVPTQTDLGRALVDEDMQFLKGHGFVSSAATMKAFDPSVDWGGKLVAFVGDAATAGDNASVCISESSPTGFHFNIAKVATGPHAGVYLNSGGDCSSLAPGTLAGAWSTGW